ncbi:MAG: NHL repeat-containing protein [Pirellulaceae bacterium]
MKNQMSRVLIWMCGVAVGSNVALPRGQAQRMQYPFAATMAENGVVFVADSHAPAIWAFENGELEKYFEASKDYRTPLNRPQCLALDPDGNLLVGDSATREVYRFDDAGNPVPLTDGKIGIPRAIVVMPGGDLMVTDRELHCIWKVPADGGVPERFAAVQGVIGMCGDDDGNLWVTSGRKPKLRKITPDGETNAVVTDGPFQFPQEVAIDDSNTVFVADNYAKTIWKISPGRKPVPWVEGDPLVSPIGVTWTGDKLIVTDPHAKAVFQVDDSGTVTQLVPAG